MCGNEYEGCQYVVVPAGESIHSKTRFKAGGNHVGVLSRINVAADDARHVVITHMHFDHANGVTLFPEAIFYIQEDEYRL